MNVATQQSAFESLQLIESRCKQRALGLPQKIRKIGVNVISLKPCEIHWEVLVGR